MQCFACLKLRFYTVFSNFIKTGKVAAVSVDIFAQCEEEQQMHSSFSHLMFGMKNLVYFVLSAEVLASKQGQCYRMLIKSYKVCLCKADDERLRTCARRPTQSAELRVTI